MTFKHSRNATLKMATVCINHKTILNIVIAVFWLPDCMESQSINVLEFKQLARFHLSTVICHPFNNCMTVWVS